MKTKDWTNYCATTDNRNQCSENCTVFPICKIKVPLVDIKEKINYKFADMDALLRHRFEGIESFEDIIEEIFNYKEELLNSLEEPKAIILDKSGGEK